MVSKKTFHQNLYKLKNYVMVSFFCLLLGQNVFGQSSLPKLIDYTLKHSNKVKKAELQLSEANYLRREVLGKGLPQAEATASYSRMAMGGMDINTAQLPQEYAPMIEGLLDGLGHMYMSSMGVQITQLIYSQSYLVGLQTAKKTQELYSVLKTKSEEDVISEVALNYYQAGSLMLQLQTIEKSLENLNEMLRIAELNHKQDLMKETDLGRLKVSVTNLESTRQTLKNSIQIQLNYIKALAGMPQDSAIAINAEEFLSTSATFSAPSFNIENVPAYKAMMAQQELSLQQIKVSEADHYPTLAAYGKFTYSSYNTKPAIEKLSKQNTIGLQLKIPIFTSGVNNSKLKQQRLKYQQLNEDIQLNKQLLAVDYSSAISEYQTAVSLLSVQKENKELAQKVYKQTTLQYQEGVASMADLLNVNADFLQADNSYNQQALKCKTSEIKILKATGNLKQLTK